MSNKENKDLQCCVTKCDLPIDEKYWENRWENAETGWDIGYPSPAIVEFMKQYPDKNAKILIPGCGNAYEAEFLLKNGFSNITLIDIASNAVEILKNKFRNDPQINVIHEDFFEHQNKYDLIIEQTFFCAIPPSMRNNYAEKSHEILNENGKIIGLLFDKFFDEQGPPFGGSSLEYQSIFEPYFDIMKMEKSYNSIPQRQGSEVFINLKKKTK